MKEIAWLLLLRKGCGALKRRKRVISLSTLNVRDPPYCNTSQYMMTMPKCLKGWSLCSPRLRKPNNRLRPLVVFLSNSTQSVRICGPSWMRLSGILNIQSAWSGTLLVQRLVEQQHALHKVARVGKIGLPAPLKTTQWDNMAQVDNVRPNLSRMPSKHSAQSQ